MNKAVQLIRTIDAEAMKRFRAEIATNPNIKELDYENYVIKDEHVEELKGIYLRIHEEVAEELMALNHTSGEILC